MTIEMINENIIELAQARNEVVNAKAQIKELQSQPIYASAIEWKRKADAMVKILDTDIRDLAGKRIDEGLELGHPALGKRAKTTVDFDEGAAIQWAIKKEFFGMLKIDTTAFKKLARSLAEAKQPIPNVEIITAPQVTIATDLSAWLEQETSDELNYGEAEAGLSDC